MTTTNTAPGIPDLLNWRYATKAMDASQKVPQDKIDRIIEAVRMAPTSSGMQPFEVFVITNPELKTQLRGAAYDQSVVSDSSHLFVFAAWDNYTAERIDEVRTAMEEVRGASDNLTGYYEMIKSMYLPRPVEVNHDHAARQAYIALGFAMLAAAELQVDTTPIEGFDPAAVDEILGLAEKGLGSVVLMAVGYRDTDNDWLADRPKVRKSRDLLVTEIS